jgi:hypothetical protein
LCNWRENEYLACSSLQFLLSLVKVPIMKSNLGCIPPMYVQVVVRGRARRLFHCISEGCTMNGTITIRVLHSAAGE